VEVPVAVDKDDAARRPHIPCRHPDPVFVGRRPIPRPPHVVIVLIPPHAGDPEVVVIGSGSVGAYLLAGRRLRQITHVLQLQMPRIPRSTGSRR
jgi:hypothetical protein